MNGNGNDIDAWSKDRIRLFEGYSERVYNDHLGNPTGGYGHHFSHGSKLPKTIWNKIFDFDYWVAEEGYRSLNLNLEPIRRAVIIDMIFNMGIHKVSAFTKMLACLRAGQYLEAADHLLDSLYAQQLPRRAMENAAMLASGDQNGGVL